MSDTVFDKLGDVSPPQKGHWSRRWQSYRRFGVRNGIVAFVSRCLMPRQGRKLPGYGKVMGMRVKNADKPVFIRLGTSDVWVFQEIFLDGEYDAVRRLQLHDVRTVVDLGSNIGLSIRYWRMLYPQARIVGVEPDAANMSVCERNAAAADGPESVLVQCCVAGTNRKVTLDRSAPAWAFKIEGADTGNAGRAFVELGSSAGSPGNAVELEAMTMPEVLRKAAIEGDIDLLKCDIEGAEAEVFGQCSEWIGRVRVLVIELHGTYTRERFERDLLANGFHGTIQSLKHVDDVHVLLVHRDRPATSSTK